jgi:hypothetical protein
MYIKVFEPDGRYLEMELDQPTVIITPDGRANIVLNSTNPNFGDIHLDLSYTECVDLALLMSDTDTKLTRQHLCGVQK